MHGQARTAIVDFYLSSFSLIVCALPSKELLKLLLDIHLYWCFVKASVVVVMEVAVAHDRMAHD